MVDVEHRMNNVFWEKVMNFAWTGWNPDVFAIDLWAAWESCEQVGRYLRKAIRFEDFRKLHRIMTGQLH